MRARTIAFTAVTAAVLALLTAPAEAGKPRAINAENLARGADAHLTYTDGSRIYPGAGGSLALPEASAELAKRSLLGRSRAGWLLWDREAQLGGGTPGYRQILHLVLSDGSSRVLYQHFRAYQPFNDYFEQYRLSDNGYRVAELIGDEGSGTITVRTLANEVRGTTTGAAILDFSGPRMVVDNGRTYVWKPGSTPRQIDRRHADFADLAHDVVFLRAADGRYGPTRLSDTGRLRWRSTFRPLDVSPDGSKVVGLRSSSGSGTRVVQVRRLRTGRVLAAYRVDTGGAVRWEGNRAILFQDVTPKGPVLVRCRIDGPCRRATPYRASELSFALP